MIHRRTIGLVLLVVALVVALLAGGLFALGEYVSQDSYSSEYSYDVRMTTNGTVTNATFLVPVPVQDGEVTVTGAIDDGDYYSQPEAFAQRLVETERGPMLAVTVDEWVVEPEYYRFVEGDDGDDDGWTEPIPADEYDPDDPDTFVRDHEYYELTLQLESDDAIETRDPIDAEPLLEPRFDAAETACAGGAERCYEYAGLVYAEYDADPSTEVSVRVSHEGQNSWWVGGWNGNWYSDVVTVDLVGPQADWTGASGDLETGWGTYR